jgi:hypothetical protein
MPRLPVAPWNFTGGYPDCQSVVPGETLQLHASTPAPQFRVEFYRLGVGLVSMGSSDWGIPNVPAF